MLSLYEAIQMTDETSAELTNLDEEVEVTEQITESSTVVDADQQKDTNDGVQARINKITAEKYEAKREADALKAQIAELQKVKEPTVADAQIIEPTTPTDMFDEDAVRKYHQDSAKYYREVAKQEATTAANSAYEQRLQGEQQAKVQQQHKESLRTYMENGLTDGLTVETMEQNEKVVGQSGIKPDVGNYIMTQPNAAKLIDLLAKSPDDLHKLNAMHPMDAAAYIANDLKAKSLGQSNTTKAPDPISPLSGATGARQDDDVPGLVIL